MNFKKRFFFVAFRLLLLGITSFASLLTQCIHIFRETRAIPAEEFPPAVLLFSWEQPSLFVQKGAFFFLFFWLLLNLGISLFSGRNWRTYPKIFWSDFFVLAALLGTWFSIYSWCIVFLGSYLSLLFELNLYLDRHSSSKTNCLWVETECSQKNSITLPTLFGLFLLAVLLCSFLELVFYTFFFTPDLFTTQDFLQFTIFVTSASILFSFRFSLEIYCCFFLAKRLFQKKRNHFFIWFSFWGASLLFLGSAMPFAWSWIEIGTGILVLSLFRQLWNSKPLLMQQLITCTLIPYLYFWARTKDITMQVLGDEIQALGLYSTVLVGFGLLGLFLLFGMTAGLFFFSRYFSLNSRQDLCCIAIFSSVFPFFLLFPQKFYTSSWTTNLRRMSLCAILVLSLLGLVLVKLNYPGFVDHSELLEGPYSLLLTHISFLGLFLFFAGVCSIRLECGKKSIWGTLLLGLCAIFFFFSLSQKQTLRMIGSQYSKIGKRSLQQIDFLSPLPTDIKILNNFSNEQNNFFGDKQNFPVLPQTSFYQQRRPPIFLILWDAARADHMSAYGYSRKTTPTVEEFSKESILFKNAYSNATATTLSIRHLLTGKYSSRYMLATDHAPFFTGALAENGYDCFLLNIFGSDFNGVSQNAFLRNQKNKKQLEKITYSFDAYEASYKTKKAITLLTEMLEKRSEKKFPADGIFMMLHYSETHYPWQNWDDHPIYGETLLDRYDNSMGHQDKALADFLNALKQLKIYEEAIIILTSDHGTGLGEHGRYGGFQPYQEQIRVPLIIKLPKFLPAQISVPVAGIDLAPTMLSLFQAGQTNSYDGLSLLDVMNGTNQTLSRRYLVSFNSFRDSLILIDLQTQHKTHLHRTENYTMLYHLGTDPQEKRNLADQELEQTKKYRQLLHEFLWNGRHIYGNPFHYRDWTPTK